MFLDRFFSEKKIRACLCSLTKQRVAMVIQPGSIWVIENAPKRSPEFENSMKTCLLRGWVVVLHEGVPSTSLDKDGGLTSNQNAQTIFRITEAGWAVVNRTNFWTVGTFYLAFLTLIATLVTFWRS